MPKNFFKTFIVIISILLFSAGIVNSVSANNSSEVYPSQCSVTDPNSGKESGCSHAKDNEILNNQCKKYYSDSVCSSMQTYLGKMRDDCLAEKPAGIDCDRIAAGGFYGNEASKFAAYLASNSSSKPGFKSGGSDSLGLDAISSKFGIPDPKGGIHQILEKLLMWMLELIGLIALIAFVISGTQYFLAFGDETRTEKAKKAMTYAIIGVVVALAGFVIVKAVDAALRATGKIF